MLKLNYFNLRQIFKTMRLISIFYQHIASASMSSHLKKSMLAHNQIKNTLQQFKRTKILKKPSPNKKINAWNGTI